MATEGCSELGSPVPAPPAKRRKMEPPPRNKRSQDAVDKVATSSSDSIAATPLVRVDLNKVREAKRIAVLQAQHEGCLGSYKSFDSLFGNYLVPVIPTDDSFEQTANK